MKEIALYSTSNAADEQGAPCVYTVVPVHNRLAATRAFVEQILLQDYDAWLALIVDDGSRDGTAEYLTGLSDPRIRVLGGSGDLWWGGAMTLGMRQVFAEAGDRDYLLMLNDDVQIGPHYLSQLVEDSRAHGGAVVGSSQRFTGSGKQFSAAYRVHYLAMRFELVDPDGDAGEIGALTGRGVLFPMALARAAGVIHAGLPHHLGDLEYTARIKERGGRLIVSKQAEAATDDVPGVSQEGLGATWKRRLGSRSPQNVWQRLVFFHSRGPWLLRLTAAPRYLMIGLLRWMGVIR